MKVYIKWFFEMVIVHTGALFFRALSCLILPACVLFSVFWGFDYSQRYFKVRGADALISQAEQLMPTDTLNKVRYYTGGSSNAALLNE